MTPNVNCRHMCEIRPEIERLKEQWQIARREGKEEKARELGNHIEELMVKLKHLAGELNADEREAEEKRDQDRKHEQEAGHQEARKLEEHANGIRKELGKLEELFAAAREEGMKIKRVSLKGTCGSLTRNSNT